MHIYIQKTHTHAECTNIYVPLMHGYMFVVDVNLIFLSQLIVTVVKNCLLDQAFKNL